MNAKSVRSISRVALLLLFAANLAQANQPNIVFIFTGSLDGEDRSQVILGRPSPRSKPLMWEYRFGNWGRDIQISPQLAMLNGDWKLLMNPDNSRVELYNLREDITETENRARYETEIVRDMSHRLMQWWNSEVPSPKKAPPLCWAKALEGSHQQLTAVPPVYTG